MGLVGGSRFYSGGRGASGETLGQPTAWTCPTCRNKNLSVVTDGCPQCGAGSPAEAAEAASRRTQVVDPDTVAKAVLGQPTATVTDLQQVRVCFGTVAQLTLARALAHYAEHGAPALSGDGVELPRPVILAWARLMDPPEPTA